MKQQRLKWWLMNNDDDDDASLALPLLTFNHF